MRQRQKLSQGDVEAQTGVPECYVSSVEEGKTIPDIETLEKLACALEIPLSSFFYDAQSIPCLPNLSGRLTAEKNMQKQAGRAIMSLMAAPQGGKRWTCDARIAIARN